MVSCGGDNGGDDNNGGSGEEQPQEIAGYRYVDLGLPSGLKWAVHNMGATSPTEYGDYSNRSSIFRKYIRTRTTTLQMNVKGISKTESVKNI